MSGSIDWLAVLRRIAPRGRKDILSGLADAMPQIIPFAELTTRRRQAHFLAQIAHESDGFRTTTEYASGAAYEGRRDLGNTHRGDGRRFKGRGLIQLTGRANYAHAARVLGVDLIEKPALAAQFPYAVQTAALYWRDRRLNRYADDDDVYAVTRAINGGFNGLNDRKNYLHKAKLELNETTLAQHRLAALNFPSGKPDGAVGLLTRSAIRDFQDAHDLPVTGQLDKETKDILFSPDANVRPVSEYRASLTAEDLQQEGSQTIAGAKTAELSAVGTGLATIASVSTQIGTISDNVTGIAEGVKSGQAAWTLIRIYWPVGVLVLAAGAGLYFAWRAYQGAKLAEEQRVLNARRGINVMR